MAQSGQGEVLIPLFVFWVFFWGGGGLFCFFTTTSAWGKPLNKPYSETLSDTIKIDHCRDLVKRYSLLCSDNNSHVWLWAKMKTIMFGGSGSLEWPLSISKTFVFSFQAGGVGHRGWDAILHILIVHNTQHMRAAHYIHILLKPQRFCCVIGWLFLVLTSKWTFYLIK